MTMEKRHLITTLKELHAELSQAQRADPETLALLGALTEDIDRLLEGKADTSDAAVGPVSRGLKNLLLKFEAEHPEVSSAIGKVADALAAIGI